MATGTITSTVLTAQSTARAVSPSAKTSGQLAGVPPSAWNAADAKITLAAI